jgi:hypothetical protein
MIRIALECLFVFLLPAVLYFGYVRLSEFPASAARSWSDRFDAAPLGWLFAAGTACLFATLLAFATLQDDNTEQPYHPAIVKDGKILPGGQK